MITRIAYVDLGSNRIDEEEWRQQWLPQVPNFLLPKTNRLRHVQDQQLHVFGWLLLPRLMNLETPHSWWDDIAYGHRGKPYFRNIPGNFNLAHSGAIAICAWNSQLPVGVDIEQIKSIDLRDFHRVMNQDQWSMINAHTNPQHLFFQFWAIKESVIKADGRGVAMNLKSIQISDQQVSYHDKKWFYQNLQIQSGYKASLAMEKQIGELEITPYQPSELLSLD